MSIRTKIGLLCAAAIVFVACLAGLILDRQATKVIRANAEKDQQLVREQSMEALRQKTRILTAYLSRTARDAVYELKLGQLDVLVREARAVEDVVGVELIIGC